MKQRWTRLLPIMMISFIISFLDRTNIGFAIPTMGKELNFSADTLGFASGVLFLGYAVSQAIGGWIADKGYGKSLVAILMVFWGATEIAQAYITTSTQLVIVRFALGFFEGGIFPTFLLFVKNWFSPSERARANGIWQLCYPLAAIVGGPIAGYMLHYGDWRSLFITEGIFPIVWVVVWIWGIADSPRKAKWLKEEEREALLQRLENENTANPVLEQEPGYLPVWSQMIRKPVILFTTAVFFWNIGFLGFIIWLPSVINQQDGLSSTVIGWLSAIPFIFSIVVMQFLTYGADRTMNRRLFVTVPLALSGVCLIVGGLTFSTNTFMTNMILLTISGAALYGAQPVLWSILTDILPTQGAGTVMGIINGISVIGAFSGPYLVGYIKNLTGSFSYGLLVLGGALLFAGFCTLQIREASRDSAKCLSN